MDLEEFTKQIYVATNGELQYIQEFLSYVVETDADYSLYSYLKFIQLHLSIYDRLKKIQNFATFGAFLKWMYPQD